MKAVGFVSTIGGLAIWWSQLHVSVAGATGAHASKQKSRIKKASIAIKPVDYNFNRFDDLIGDMERVASPGDRLVYVVFDSFTRAGKKKNATDIPPAVLMNIGKERKVMTINASEAGELAFLRQRLATYKIANDWLGPIRNGDGAADSKKSNLTRHILLLVYVHNASDVANKVVPSGPPKDWLRVIRGDAIKVIDDTKGTTKSTDLTNKKNADKPQIVKAPKLQGAAELHGRFQNTDVIKSPVFILEKDWEQGLEAIKQWTDA